MAEFKSKYASLGFYVDGVMKTFSGGRYVTEDAKEIEALSKVTDAQRVDKPKAKDEAPKAEDKGDDKPKAKRKPSAK